ncbi:MAG: WD40 repeat domain-containing protein [Anaerolineae bacterium]
MLRKLSVLIFAIASVLLLACGDGSSHYPENDGIPNNCEYANAEFYRPNIFARFDNNARRITLVDWNTGETVDELATDTDAANVSVLSWSPNCRYLGVRQDGSGVFYDVVTGAQVAAFPSVRPFDSHHTNITWDSTSTYVTVESERDTVLKNILTGAQVTLANYHFRVQYWSVPFNRLYAFSSMGIIVYDLTTGAEIGNYSDLMHYRYTQLAFSPDHSLVVFYNGHAEDDHITILNQNTLAMTEVYAGDYAEPVVAISADNHYLAMGGYTLSVWDLQNLPASDSHAPLYQYTNVPALTIDGLRFIDSSTLEINNDGYLFNWNFVTGEQVP